MFNFVKSQSQMFFFGFLKLDHKCELMHNIQRCKNFTKEIIDFVNFNFFLKSWKINGAHQKNVVSKNIN